MKNFGDNIGRLVQKLREMRCVIREMKLNMETMA